jgi:hypothetical protein
MKEAAGLYSEALSLVPPEAAMGLHATLRAKRGHAFLSLRQMTEALADANSGLALDAYCLRCLELRAEVPCCLYSPALLVREHQSRFLLLYPPVAGLMRGQKSTSMQSHRL